MATKENSYSYPIDPDWTIDEMKEVIGMFRVVEDVLEPPLFDHLPDQYKKFKQVANSKAYEKQLGKRFEDVSGYSLYKVMQVAKEKTAGKIRVNQDGK